MPAINRPFYQRVNGHGKTRNVPYSSLDRNIASDYRRHVGVWLRERRVELGLTQSELGEMIGVGHSVISTIETGVASVPPDRYEAMAKALEIPHEEFGELLLRYSNPWLWGMINGFTPALREELGMLYPRQGGPSQTVIAGRKAP